MMFFFFCDSFQWLMKENKSGLPWKFKIGAPKHWNIPPMSYTGPWGSSDHHQSTEIKRIFPRNAWAWQQPFRPRQSGLRNYENGKSRCTWIDMKTFRQWKTIKNTYLQVDQEAVQSGGSWFNLWLLLLLSGSTVELQKVHMTAWRKCSCRERSHLLRFTFMH